MQEDVESKCTALIISGSKLSAKILAKGMKFALKKIKESRVPELGKQSMKKLGKQGDKLQDIEITDDNIKSFDPIARKYGVSYALKRDNHSIPPKNYIFFKSKDTDAMTAAFTEFTAKTLNRKKELPSVLNLMRELKEKVKQKVLDRNRTREREQSL